MRSFMRLKQRSTVVLPQPDGPMKAVISCWRISKRDVAHGPEVAVVDVEVLDVEDDRSTGVLRRIDVVFDFEFDVYLVTVVGAGVWERHQAVLFFSKRLRSRMAAALAMSTMTSSTTMAAAARARKSGSGWPVQVVMTIGMAVKRSVSWPEVEEPVLAGQPAGHRADEDQRRRLAQRPGQGQHGAGEDAGRGVGQDVAADDLPPGGAHAEARLADAAGHGPQGLGRGDDHDGQHQHGEGDPAGDGGAAAGDGLQDLDEDGEPEDAVDDRRHAGQVADVEVDEAGEPALRRVLLEVDRRADADGEREHDHGDADPERAAQALEDAGLVGLRAQAAREEGVEPRSVRTLHESATTVTSSTARMAMVSSRASRRPVRNTTPHMSTLRPVSWRRTVSVVIGVLSGWRSATSTSVLLPDPARRSGRRSG